MASSPAPIALLSLVGAVGVLAGCAAPSATVEEPATDSSVAEQPSAEATTDTDTETDTGTDTAQNAFADGIYTADGEYFAPSGPESITVTITVDDDTVTAVEVVGHATDTQAKQHQADFSDGIASAVVGQSLAGLAVDRVAGSSLTGTGFNEALDAIRADAAA